MFKLKHALTSLVVALGVFIFFNSSAHAASFTVAAGNDENTDNASCALSEAIENINDGAQTNTDCVEAGAYGTDDTINLPIGTITLTADLALLSKPVSITGQGMGVSTIDGDSQYSPFIIASSDPDTSASLTGFTVSATQGGGFQVQGVKNVTVSNVEVDGNGTIPHAASGGLLMGFVLVATDSEEYNFDVDNVYVHDLEGDVGSYENLMGIMFAVGNGSTVTATVDNTTVENIHATGAGDNASAIQFSTAFSSFTATDLTATVSNATVYNISSDFAGASGIAASNIINDSDTPSVIDMVVRNSTVSNLTAATSVTSAGIGSGGAAALATDDVTTNVTLINNLISGTLNNCYVYDITSLIGGAGAPVTTFSSQGGNLSDDNSCSSYFTQPTDQNNLTNLASTLSPLADNGGFVPTMALLQGSPAIDSGVTVSGLTTDARQATRPQGTAYDSGAYESPYSKATASLAGTGEGVNTYMLSVLTMLALGICFTFNFRRLNS